MASTKKIVFVQDGLGGGGAEHVICALSNQFIKDGYDVEIGLYESNDIAYTLNPDVKVTMIDREHFHYRSNLEKAAHFIIELFAKVVFSFLNIGVIKSHDKTGRIEKLKRQFHHQENKLKAIRRFVEERNDTVIISFMVHCFNMLYSAISDIDHSPVIISERDDPNVVKSESANNMRIASMQKADRCVFQTEQAKMYFGEPLKFKGIVIPNPICIDCPEPYEGPREKIIVNYCRLHKKKNLTLLISAFETLVKQYPDYKLYIYGNGDQKDNLLELIREKKLEGKAFIFDFRQDIHEVIRRYSMFVSSSDSEGISNSMIEAMSMGMPVICTDCPIGGASMMIESYKNGILTPVGDERSLFEAMKYMIENPDKANEMGMQATKIRERLSIERIAKAWEKEIDTLYLENKDNNSGKA